MLYHAHIKVKFVPRQVYQITCMNNNALKNLGNQDGSCPPPPHLNYNVSVYRAHIRFETRAVSD